MAVEVNRSLNSELREGATDGTIKKIPQADHSGCVDPFYNSHPHEAPYYGVNGGQGSMQDVVMPQFTKMRAGSGLIDRV